MSTTTTTDEDEPFKPLAPAPTAAEIPPEFAKDYNAYLQRKAEREAARRSEDGKARNPIAALGATGNNDWLAEFRRPLTPEEIAEDAVRVAEAKAERDRDDRSRALAEWMAAVPESMRTTDWKDRRLIPYQTEISRIRTWKHGPKGIYAVGRSGRGKSRSIYALARRLAVDELVPVRYLLQTEITREVNRDGLNSFLEKLDGLRRAPVIVWDDFGKFAAIGSRRDLLCSEIESLIDFRFSHGLPFLISANARDKDIVEIFGEMRGEPILRRIVEGCEVVSFGWE